MNFTFTRIVLTISTLLLLGVGGGALELAYEVDQFGPAVSMVSLKSRADVVATALSADGKTFRVHKPEGVFVDKSPFGFHPGGVIQKIDQVRGANGTDLVVSFTAPVVVEGRESGDLMRFVFVAATEAVPVIESKPPALGGDPVAERKIAELRDLVRQLTLEVVEQRKKLARCGK